MSFLQPLVLAALPLIALPVLIHLINRYRHRSVPWAAMMFLLRAKRMNQGMARLRQWLILLMRTLAVATLIFAVSRPLATGWWGGLGMARPDATLILLDRSASMEARDLQTGESKRSTALRKLAELLDQRGGGGELVLIESAAEEARTLDSPAALPDLFFTSATATRADVPGLLERALAYLEANDTGRADLWLCSDLQADDWNLDSGRWPAIREQLARRPGVRLFLLAYPKPAGNNRSVRVTQVKCRQRGEEAELILDIAVKRSPAPAAESSPPNSLPLEFQIGGVRSVAPLEMDAAGGVLRGHRIPLAAGTRAGWGRVTVPADANPLDNQFYFVFAEPPVRRSVVVADDAGSAAAFRLALNIPPEPGLRHEAVTLPPARAGEIDWENTALLVWQAEAPTGLVAEQLRRFVESGRRVLFFPPTQGPGAALFGARWREWQTLKEAATGVGWWRGDADLLAHVGSGDPLPVDDLRIYRARDLTAEGTVLARGGDNRPLLLRAPTRAGGVYFCATLPTARYSSLERQAVVFYALLQRALAEGSRALAPAVQRDAAPGALPGAETWERVAPPDDPTVASQRELRAGVYRQGRHWVALNRPATEDTAPLLPAASVDELFAGAAYQRIDDAVGDSSPLAREVWRAFLLAMMAALLLEAVLCLPEKRPRPGQLGGFTAGRAGLREETS